MGTPVNIKSLITDKEGWEIVDSGGVPMISAFNQRFEVRHPAQVYLKLYRTEVNPESKYLYMKAAHDYLWPETEWHYWTEERFREHCAGWNYMSWAAGGSASKSFDAAKVSCLFWLANPRKRGVVIASTTLESLGARIWGYATKFISKMAVKLPFQYLGGNSPKILYPQKRSDNEIRDTIHGMFAVAAKGGDAEKSISSWIGRHPEDALLLILDEATDINANVINSFANLDTGGKPFQCIAIGNSNSVDDLHGALSTPVDGWGSIDPMKDKKWRTTRKNGVCLFFSCYESPAIYEVDKDKKLRLGKFLITQDTIDAKKRELGEDSDAFWRFVLGFWRLESTEDRIVSKQFMEGFGSGNRTEWGGMYPLKIVGGLDTAFSTGGDQCILRLGVLGYDTSGLMVLDFMDGRLTYVIPILRSSGDDASIQIGKQVVALLKSNRCALEDIAIDATGQGRAMGGVLQLMWNTSGRGGDPKKPISIYSTKMGVSNDDSFDVIVKSAYELWYTIRDFIQEGQIKGLDTKTMMQLSSRQVIYNHGKSSLESKRDYKKRMGAKDPKLAHSPDHADAAALAVQAAIRMGGLTKGKRKMLPKADNFDHLKLIIHRQEEEDKKALEKRVVRALPRATFLGSLESLSRRKPF